MRIVRFVAGLLLAAPVIVSAQSYEVVHSFGVSGGWLVSRLLLASDGRLLGVAQNGGFFSSGSIFALTPDGQGGYAYSELHAFSGPDGQMPFAGLIEAAGGGFYGTTSLGGASGFGTVFFMDRAGSVTTLHDFTGTAASDGANPAAPVLQGSDGNFYGTAGGGAFGGGCVYRVDAAGTVTLLHNFSGPDGAGPAGELIEATDGKFYGTTNNGGDNGLGVIFRVDGAGGFAVVAHLDDASGGFPVAGLVEAHPGDFFGVATVNGANGFGTIFRVSAAGDLVAVHSFDQTDGDNPRSTLLLAADGKLYGTTSAGGQHANGTIFRVDPDTAGFESFLSIDPSDGRSPDAGLVTLADGRLGGVLKNGGPDPDYGAGTVYAVDSAASLELLHAFVIDGGAFPDAGLVQGSDGNLYGTTGDGPGGNVFRVNTDGDYFVLHNFVAGDGSHPTSRLLEASNGSFYGVTDFVGQPWGNIFKVTSAGDFASIHDFDGTDGWLPQAGLIESGGYLYSTTANGGGFGNVYRTDLDGNVESLHAFANTDGSNPAAALLLASDGNFYGTTKEMTKALGSVFRMDSDFQVTTIHAFQAPEGAAPGAELIEPVAGTLYGTTLAGGTGGLGTVFQMDLNGQITTLHNFSGPDGDQPRCGLVQANDGDFYGTTAAGGTHDSGTLFKIASDGTFNKLHDFDTATGAFPTDTLVLASDGNLYGVAVFSTIGGTVFRWLTTPSTASLTSIVPSSGPASGGTSITVSGAHLKPGQPLSIGGNATTGQIDVDMHTVRAISPSLPPGTLADVTLGPPAGTPEGGPTGIVNGWVADFLDVSSLHPFHDFVVSIVRAGITAGCGGGTYCPNAPVTRAQMAVFLLKAEHGAAYIPPDCQGAFPDVPCPGPFTNWIEQLAAEGITGGCGGGNYCPASPVTRAQMAVFLLKTSLGSSYVPPLAAGIFGDVPVGSFAADWIEDLYGRQITGGCSASPLLYCPNNANTRGQMAVFLTKTFSLP